MTNQSEAGTCVATEDELHGVVFKPLVDQPDFRGAFMEVFKDEWQLGIAPVQWSVVRSGTGVFRGMHLHWHHDEYFCLVSGHFLVGLYDIRPDSPTRGQYSLYEFTEEHPMCVCFPPGVLHGIYYFTPSIHLQAVSESYTTYRLYDNLGCRWDDPVLNIPWPFTDPILSKEAASYSSVKTLLSDAP